MFIKVCPNCKSSNIKNSNPVLGNDWICINCGNRKFFPLEVTEKDIKKMNEEKTKFEK